MKIKNLFSLVILFITIYSCNKREEILKPIIPQSKSSLFFPEKGSLRSPTTPEEIKMVQEIKSVTPLLLEVYKNPLARREINAAIYSGYYLDESVMLKDLLEYDKSPVYRNSKFQTLCSQPGVFAAEFNKAQKSLDLKISLRVGSENYNEYGNIVIYFPYSESYQNTPENQMSLLPAEFEGNYGIGFEPILCTGGICYDTTMIDDCYAALENPTHIITTGPLDPAPPTPNSVDSIPPQPQPQLVVYWGWMRQNQFLDPLVSIGGGSLNRGGNEVRVNRTSAYLRTSTTGDITDFSQPRLDFHFTRSEIANRTWKRLYSILDPSWEVADLEQVISVWEEDNATEVEKGGSFTTTASVDSFGISVQQQRQFTFKLKYRTKNNSSIYAMPWSRNDYVRVSRDQFSPTGYNLRPTNNVGPSILGLPFAILNQTGQTKDGTFLPPGQFWPIMEPELSTGSWVWPHRIF